MTDDDIDTDDDIELRAVATAAFAEVERGVDVDAAFALVDTNAEVIPLPSASPLRRRWLAAAAVVVALVGVGAVVWAARQPDQVRMSPGTVPDTTVTTATTATTAATDTTAAPATTEPATTVPDTTAVPTTQLSTSTTAVRALSAVPFPGPLAELFATASEAAAGPHGLWLGIGDGTAATWYLTGFETPLTGPALLVDGIVVTQASDPMHSEPTSGPITLITAAGASTWAPPDADPLLSYRLLDVGHLDGAPVMLISQAKYNGPDDSFDHLLRVEMSDLADMSVTELGDFGGWEAGIRGARIVNDTTSPEFDTIVILRGSGTDNDVVSIGLDGTVTGQSAWLPDTWGSLSSDGTRYFWFGFEVDADDLSRYDLVVNDEQRTELPAPFDGRCGFASFDGVVLRCHGDGAPTSFDVVTRQWTTWPLPDASIVTRRPGVPAPAIAPSPALLRPYVDPSVCVGEYADELVIVDRYPSPFASGRHRFGWYQVFSAPTEGLGVRFALVAEYNRANFAPSQSPNEWVGDRAVSMHVGGNTAIANFELPDGRVVLVRAFGFDETAVLDLIGALTPRSLDGSTPGFELADGAALEMLVDQGDTPIDLEAAVFNCGPIRVAAAAGDALAQYLSILDQPMIHEIGFVDGTLVSIAGGNPEYVPMPRLTDVVPAPPDVWEALVAAPPPPPPARW